MKILLVSPANVSIVKEVKIKGITREINVVESIYNIKSEEDICEVIMTVDLYQFDKTTLTGNIFYNLLPCKQIHIITKDNLPNEKYLEKQLSIAMFFYCTEIQHYQYLLEKYPDIPYLKLVEGWKEQNDAESAESNAQILSDIVEEVMQICHME